MCVYKCGTNDTAKNMFWVETFRVKKCVGVRWFKEHLSVQYSGLWEVRSFKYYVQEVGFRLISSLSAFYSSGVRFGISGVYLRLLSAIPSSLIRSSRGGGSWEMCGSHVEV